MEPYVIFTLGVACGIIGSYLVSDLVFAPVQQRGDEDED
jgi:hypothetical protein